MGAPCYTHRAGAARLPTRLLKGKETDKIGVVLSSSLSNLYNLEQREKFLFLLGEFTMSGSWGVLVADLASSVLDL